jgi:hypothetical protein
LIGCADEDVGRVCRERGVSVLFAQEMEGVGEEITWILPEDPPDNGEMDDTALNATVLGRLRMLGYI